MKNNSDNNGNDNETMSSKSNGKMAMTIKMTTFSSKYKTDPMIMSKLSFAPLMIMAEKEVTELSGAPL